MLKIHLRSKRALLGKLTGKKQGQPRDRFFRGQVTLELTIGLVASLIFLLGTVQIFFWFNRCLVERQQAYESTRLNPLSTSGAGVNLYTPPKLYVFPEEE